jgi:hypothetical protein
VSQFLQPKALHLAKRLNSPGTANIRRPDLVESKAGDNSNRSQRFERPSFPPLRD